jgi:hypothetical protein
VSNTVTLPIVVGGGVCSDPAFGVTGTDLATLSGNSTVNPGQVNMSQLASPGTNGASQITADAYLFRSSGAPANGGGQVSLDGCTLNETITGGSALGIRSPGLNPGTITLTGSAGSQFPLTGTSPNSGVYLAPLLPLMERYRRYPPLAHSRDLAQRNQST